MITDGRGAPFYLKTSFVDSQVRSAWSNQIRWCFSIVRGMAARTLKFVKKRRALGNRKAFFKREEGSHAFWGPKNNAVAYYSGSSVFEVFVANWAQSNQHIPKWSNKVESMAKQDLCNKSLIIPVVGKSSHVRKSIALGTLEKHSWCFLPVKRAVNLHTKAFCLLEYDQLIFASFSLKSSFRLSYFQIRM